MDSEKFVLNRGVVFPSLPRAILFESGWFSSSSDAVMQWLRSQSLSPERITPDLQLFNELRAGVSVSPDKFAYLCGKYAPSIKDDWIDISEEDIPCGVGAWWLLKISINLLLSRVSKHNSAFHLKLNELFQDEQMALEAIDEKESYDFANFVASKWLDLNDLDDKPDSLSHYTVRTYLMLLAIYEKFLREIAPEIDDKYPAPALLSFLLPTAGSSKLVLSNAKFCERGKYIQAQRVNEPPLTWQAFYKQIADHQKAQSSATQEPTERIKKVIQGIRSGKRKLTWRNYTSHLRVLNPDLAALKPQPVEYVALLSQLMTNLQKELISKDICIDDIERMFAYYPHIYRKLDSG